MPKMVKMVLNRSYKPETAAEKKAVENFQPFTCAYVQAIENIHNSKGMLTIASEEPGTQAPGPRRLEDMTPEELKVMLVSLGIRTQKQMKRSDVEALIRRKLDEVDVVEDDASE